MDDPSGLFRQYETEYCNKSTDISRKVSALTSVPMDMRRSKAAELEADMREADGVIKRMDMEARSLPADTARALTPKVKDYRADLASLREQLRAAAAAAGAGDAARAELGLGGPGGGGSSDYYSAAAGQRDRMLASTERLTKTSERLAHGKQQLLETEELGVSILSDLARQRETIVHARDTLHGADESINKARRVLSTMSKRVLANKIIMGGICVFLLLGIILVIYYRVRG